MTITNNKANQMMEAIQAYKMTLSRTDRLNMDSNVIRANAWAQFSPEDIAAYRAEEINQHARDARSSNIRGTF